MKLYDYKKRNLILTYVSTDIEVDTKSIIKNALESGKRTAVPRCIPGTREIEFYIVTSFENDLSEGSFKILEPNIKKCEKLNDFENGLCIIPALSFDMNGYRLGYGKGYYDRFLSKFKGLKIGLCYGGCVCEELPHGHFDERVDLLITEHYTKRINE